MSEWLKEHAWTSTPGSNMCLGRFLDYNVHPEAPGERARRDRVDYGVFTKRMHLGASQVQLYYFKREVLDRYLKNRENYEVDDDTTGGDVRMTPTPRYRYSFRR